MHYTDTIFKQQLDMARAYAEQWHAGMSVPVNVSAVKYVCGISDKVLASTGDRDAAIAACLYKGVVPNASFASLINPRTKEAGYGDNTIDSIRYFFGADVANIAFDLNGEPPWDRSDSHKWEKVAEWACCCLNRPAQIVLIAEKWANFENRTTPDIPDVETAQRRVVYCASRLKVVKAIEKAAPRLAQEAQAAGHALLRQSCTYLNAQGIRPDMWGQYRWRGD